jgi:hypothetical protein
LLCAVDGHTTLLDKNWENIRSVLLGRPGKRVELMFLRQSTVRFSGLDLVKMAVTLGKKREVVVDVQWPDPELYTERSLFLFRLTMSVRRLCIGTVESGYFQKFVLLLIAASTAVLAINDPLDDSQGSLTTASQVFSVCFAAEALIQIIARGFIFGHHAYLKNVRRNGLLFWPSIETNALIACTLD